MAPKKDINRSTATTVITSPTTRSATEEIPEVEKKSSSTAKLAPPPPPVPSSSSGTTTTSTANNNNNNNSQHAAQQAVSPFSFNFQPYLPPDAAERLARYKYAGEDRSWLYKYFWKPTCVKIVEMLPLWLAPNVITVGALV